MRRAVAVCAVVVSLTLVSPALALFDSPLPLSKILESLKLPLAAGLVALGAVFVTERLGLLSALGGASRGDRLERFVVAGAVACLAAGVTLLVADHDRRARVTALVRRRRTWAKSPQEAGAIVSDA